MNREIKVPARNVHYSFPRAPSRRHNDELSESVKQVGFQQSIVVRPIPGTQDEYEIIDGRGRQESLLDDKHVPVARTQGKPISQLRKLACLLQGVSLK